MFINAALRKSENFLITDKMKVSIYLIGLICLSLISSCALLPKKITAEAAFTIGYDAFKKGDYIKSSKWYRKSAEQGYAVAQNYLGILYNEGKGVIINDQEAIKWYQKSAIQGHAPAQYNLGIMYEIGKGVIKNQRKSSKWYRNASKQGYNDKKAAQWYRKAAEQGYAYAQNNLGVMYSDGQGVTKNNRVAVKWYRKSAEQEYAAAQTNLGFMYEIGKGIAKGILVGGNLSLIDVMIGTPYQIDFKNKILLIEEVNEGVYRIDRMLQKLRLSGVLNELKGIVIGSITNKSTIKREYGYYELFKEFLEPLHIPVLYGLPIGHVSSRLTVPIGAEVEIDINKKTLRIC